MYASAWRRRAVFVCALLGAALPAAASDQSVALGRWRTVDDHTGKPRSIVTLYQENDRVFGRVDAALDPARANRRCEQCTDERKDKPIVGMVIIRNMKKSGNELAGGDILDPDSGKVYRCKMRISDDGKTMVVRGFVGFSMLGRSQTWTREP